MTFNIPVSVKPYVKRFLENNYGNPVDFRKHPREFEMFKRMLKKPNRRWDYHYKEKSGNKYDTIEVIITEVDFYRYGWTLSPTDVVSFGKYFEKNAKYLMRTVVALYVNFGTPIDKAIAIFQEKFKMEEEFWAFESIKKDFYRIRIIENMDISSIAYENMINILSINMRGNGILTESFVKMI